MSGHLIITGILVLLWISHCSTVERELKRINEALRWQR